MIAALSIGKGHPIVFCFLITGWAFAVGQQDALLRWGLQYADRAALAGLEGTYHVAGCFAVCREHRPSQSKPEGT